MTFLKCATHVVRDVGDAADRYVRWLDYAIVEEGVVPADLAAAWMAPSSAGRRFVVLQPASGSSVFLRFVEGDEVPGYAPIRSYGWAAIEICVQDVEAVNARMLRSQAFEVIGPPKPLDGFPTVKPMQVRGPDQEIVYLTEIRVDDPASGLPTPASLVDRPFIMVLACADLERTARWTADVLGLDVSAPVSIRYSMIQLSFGLPEDETTPLAIVKGQGQTFLELDQYPSGACERPRHDGALPPGVAMTTMMHPDFTKLAPHWATPPVPREGAIYEGRRTGLVKTPEGALLEIVEGGPVA